MAKLIDELESLPDNLGELPESQHVAMIRKWHKQARNLQQELKIERQRRDALEKELETWDEYRDLAIATQGEFKAEKVKKNTRRGGEAEPIFISTDWHLEERIDADTVNGLNEYNLEIAGKRIETTAQKFVRLYEFSQHLVPMRNGVLVFMGDHINGYIHPELEESNFLGPTEAVIFAQNRMAFQIDHILDNTKLQHLRIVCKMGNHGRSTQKKRISTDYRSNWEYLAYRNLAELYRKNKRVSFQIDHSYLSFIDVLGWTYRIHHGDGIRYAGGVGGISIPVNKAISQWNKSVKADFDIFGHWHQFLNSWNFFSVGCSVGHSPYAVWIKADYQPPTQGFVVSDKERGPVMCLPVYCDTAKVRA